MFFKYFSRKLNFKDFSRQSFIFSRTFQACANPDYRYIKIKLNGKTHLSTKTWDTDSNKSFDFLLNPICIVVVL